MIAWEEDRIRTVNDLLRRTPLRGWDPRTGTQKSRRRRTKLEFRAGDKNWYFDRGHVHRLALHHDGASIVIDGLRNLPRINAVQILAWGAYWPCPDLWCDACGPSRDANGVGPLDSEVAGVVDAIWFNCNGPTPHFYRATVCASDLHALVMQARACRHPTEIVADLTPRAPSNGTTASAISVTNARKATFSMPGEYYANAFAALKDGGWNIATSNPRRTT